MTLTRTVHLDSSRRDVNRFLDHTLHVINTKADSKRLFYPPPGSVIQILSWFATVETTIGAADTDGEIGISAQENGVAYAVIDSIAPEALTGAVLTAGTFYEVTPEGIWQNGVLVDIAAADKFAPIFLDASKGDYLATGVTTAAVAGGGSETGKLYMGVTWEYIKKPCFGDNDSNYFG